jgi:hypothetical protein
LRVKISAFAAGAATQIEHPAPWCERSDRFDQSIFEAVLVVLGTLLVSGECDPLHILGPEYSEQQTAYGGIA